jgi:hypothetical protein
MDVHDSASISIDQPLQPGVVSQISVEFSITQKKTCRINVFFFCSNACPTYRDIIEYTITVRTLK